MGDIIGKKFGKLTVLHYTGKRFPKIGKEVVCKCDCGKEVVTVRSKLKSGSKKSCGCLRHEITRHKEYEGKRFNKLVAIKYFKGKWKCQCDCGKIIYTTTWSLTKGKKSCGCWVGYDPEITISNRIYDSYKWNAKRRSLSFQISKDFFRKLIKKDCYFCGQPPSQIRGTKDNPYSILYNGIDRLDNSRGYEEDNVVPCCKYCNSMKSNQNKEDFLKHIKKIYEKCFS